MGVKYRETEFVVIINADTEVDVDLFIPANCYLEQFNLIANEAGDISIDVLKTTYASFDGNDPASITGSDPLVLSSAIKSEKTDLSTWTRSLLAGDILRFKVSGVDTLTRVTLSMKVKLT